MADPADALSVAVAARRTLFDRVLRVIGGWDSASIDWLCGELEAGNIGPPAGDYCPGEGACHGPARSCETCGDVAGVCDMDDCSIHHCASCGLITADRINRVPWCSHCREVENMVETVDGEEAASDD